METINIDGAQGEGGGQILRTALSLSALTGRPFRIINIRHNRPAPGLRSQHAQCVLAAQRVCSADVRGAEIASRELSFAPGRIAAGRHAIDIGTAGSTCLVLQTIAHPLSFADAPSEVVIRGGTHNAFAPIYDYLELQWLPFMRRIGLDIDLELAAPGYYPRGGGEIRAVIRPAGALSPITVTERGPLRRINVTAAVNNLPVEIAERFVRRTESQLKSKRVKRIHSKIKTSSGAGRGTYVCLFAEYENSSACCFGLGRMGKQAEKIADEMVAEFIEFNRGGATVDRYLADQLLLPLSLCRGESAYSTPKITPHLITNADVIRRFLDARIDIEPTGWGGIVRVRPGQT